MESNVINVNIQLPNNTFLDSYEIPSEKTVGEVLQDLQDSFHIPKFVENNQFILSLVFRGYILPTGNTFGEMSIKPNSFLKVKKISKTKITESDFYQSTTPQIESFPVPITIEIPEIPDQPSPTLGLLEMNSEHAEELQLEDFHEVPTEIPNIVFADEPEPTVVSPKTTPPKKKRSKIFTAIITILATLFLLSVLFVAFIFFQFGFFGSKLNLPFNVDVLNTNTSDNANTEANANANEANTDSNTNANTESNTNTNTNGNANTNSNATPNINASPNIETNANKEVSVGVSSNTPTNAKQETNTKANAKANTKANTNSNSNSNNNSRIN